MSSDKYWVSFWKIQVSQTLRQIQDFERGGCRSSDQHCKGGYIPTSSFLPQPGCADRAIEAATGDRYLLWNGNRGEQHVTCAHYWVVATSAWPSSLHPSMLIANNHTIISWAWMICDLSLPCWDPNHFHPYLNVKLLFIYLTWKGASRTGLMSHLPNYCAFGMGKRESKLDG